MMHIFDCDGVLLDTPARKTDAFYRAALPYGEDAARAMVHIHRDAGSIGRRARWERFFAQALCREPEPGEIDGLVDITTQHVREGTRRAQPLPGVIEYAASLDNPIVVSGIETDELHAILFEHGILDLFAGAYGGDKHAILRELVADGTITLPATYYGDTYDDLIASRNAGLSFVLVSGASEWMAGESFCRAHGYDVMADFTAVVCTG